MSFVVSSVHTQSTSVKPTITCSYRDWKIQSIGVDVSLIDDFFWKIDSDLSRSYQIRWQNCSSGAWFVRDDITGAISVQSRHCHLRWCPICSSSRSKLTALHVHDTLKAHSQVRLLTLTLKHDSSDLSTMITRLYDSFRRLRKCRDFKSFVSGGIWFFQIIHSKKTLSWHPHLHCLITGKYFKSRLLSHLWRKFTGNSYIVDIRYANKRSKIVSYVTRYVSRPVNLSEVPRGLFTQLFLAFANRRLSGSWGILRGCDLRGSKTLEPRKVTRIGSWPVVCNLVSHNGNAALIIDAWLNGYPLPEYIHVRAFDDFLDNLTFSNDTGPPSNTDFLLF